MIWNKRDFGNLYETKALNFLEDKGFILLERNFYIKGGELDLIMRDQDFIVFVEVRSLKFNEDRDIYSTLSSSKKKNLSKTINHWLYKNKMQDCPWRFDYVGVTIKEGEYSIEHFEFVSLN